MATINGTGGNDILGFDDFSAGATGWSVPTVSSLAETGQFLGNFGSSNNNQATSKTFGTDPDAAYTIIEFNFLRFDSWDGGEAFDIYVDDVKVVQFTPGTSSPTGTVGNVTYTFDYVGELQSPNYYGDSNYKVQLVISGPRSSIKLGFGSNLNGAAYDESFGIDNLFVRSTNSVTEQGISLDGGAGNDTLTGVGGDDYLAGGADNDKLYGGAGNDTLNGGTGSDSLVGGEGNDTFYGGTSSPGSGNVDSMYGGAGNDQFYSGAWTEAYIEGGDGNDSFDSSGGNDTFYGGDGDDFANARGGNDALYGGAGNDNFAGREGADTIDGGEGSDWTRYDNDGGGATVDLALSGAQTADGVAKGDVLISIENVAGGGGSANKLFGNGANNILRGYDLNDTLSGRGGNDTLQGYGGSDTADYSYAAQGITVALDASGNATVTVVAGSDVDTITMFESIVGSATGANALTGNAGNNALMGGTGNDTLIGGAGNDLLSDGSLGAVINNTTFDTTDGWTLSPGGSVSGGKLNGTNQSLIAYKDLGLVAGKTYQIVLDYTYTSSSDRIPMLRIGNGTTVNDKIVGYSEALGSSGSITITFQAVDRYLSIDAHNTQFYGTLDNIRVIEFTSGGGNDTLIGGTGNDTLDGGAGIDMVKYDDAAAAVDVDLSLSTAQNTGGDGVDTLFNIEQVSGSAFNDTLRGTSGNNVLLGNDGDDTLLDGKGDDTIDGGSGWDYLSSRYSANSVTIDLRITGAQNTGNGMDVIRNIERLEGSFYNDILIGDDADNMIRGYSGDDSIDGGNGNDWILGERGHDTIYGGTGDDWITGWEDNDVLYGGAGNDSLYGGEGADVLNGGDGIDTMVLEALDEGSVTVDLGTGTITGSAQYRNDSFSSIENVTGSGSGDLLIGSRGDNTLSGMDGADTLYGGSGSDKLYGGNDSDVLRGDDGDDTLDGGAGTDTAKYAGHVTSYLIGSDASGNITVTDRYGNGGTDVLVGIEKIGFSTSTLTVVGGTTGSDTLTGTSFDEVIVGLAGTDTVNAGAGNDLIVGAESVDGGIGDDTIALAHDSRLSTLTYDSGTGTYTLSQATLPSVSFKNVENLQFTNGALATIRANGTSQNDVLLGSLNADTIIAGEGADVVWAGEGSDSVQGGGGDDILHGQLGTDTLIGGSGDDQLLGGGGADRLDGEDGFDTVRYDTASNGVTVNLATGSGTSGEAQGDTYISIEGVVGTTSADVLTGSSGNETFEGLTGNDTIDGGDGVDTVKFTHSVAGVTVDLSNSAAQNTGAGTKTLTNIENVTGSAFADVLTGSSGDNVVTGGKGNDTIVGGAGTDTAVFSGQWSDYDIVFDSVNNRYTLTDRRVGGDGVDVVSGVEKFQFSTETLLAANLINTAPTFTVQAISLIAETVRYGGTIGSAYDPTGTVIAELQSTDPNATDVLTYMFVDANGNEVANGDFQIIGNQVIVRPTANIDFETNPTITLRIRSVDLGGLYADQEVMITVGNYAANYVGTAARNIVSGTTEEDTISGGAGDDWLSGNEGHDTIDGGVGKDSLEGGAGNDSLIGGADNDTLNGGAGADTIDGGLGIDTARYTASAVGVTINLVTGIGSGGDAEGDRLSGIEAVVGSSYDDSFVGTNSADSIDAGLGDDTMSYAYANAGVTVSLAKTAVQRTGGGGIDTIKGFENLIGSNFADILIGTSGVNKLDGGLGNDQLDGGAGADVMTGGAGDDTYFVDDVGDVIVEGDGQGTDWVNSSISYVLANGLEKLALTGTGTINGTGNSADNVIIGNAKNNLLAGLGGADLLNGGKGIDTVTYAASTSAVTVNLLTRIGSGGHASGDTYIAVENVIGSTEADIITGDATANTLEGGAGADTLNGGAGLDTISYASSGEAVTVVLGVSATGGHANGDVLSNFEGVTGSAYADGLTGNALVNTVDGGAGNDTIDGGAGNDQLLGGEGADSMLGGTGNDLVAGGAGNDTIAGDAGNDTVDGGDGSDVLAGGEGIDTLSYASSTAGLSVSLHTGASLETGGSIDTLTGFENVTGSSFADIIEGDANLNILDGGSGIDTLTYINAAAGVTVSMASTAKQNTVGAGFDTIKNFENLTGSLFNDILTGNIGNNVLDGGAGNDTIYGGGGNDVIKGGAGNDTLYGGTVAKKGYDTFLFTSGGGNDTVMDFKDRVDRLDLTHLGLDWSDLTVTRLGANLTTVAYLDGGVSTTLTIKSNTQFTIDQGDFAFAA